MKVSAQEEYGLRCLLQMARNTTLESLSIPQISRAEGLSIPNVAKLMRILRLGGLVRSVRGQAGGYTLARPAEQITLEEVLRVLGGPLFGPDYCQRHAGLDGACAHGGDCAVRPVWHKMQAMISTILTRITLQDLTQSEQEMGEWLSGGDHSGRNGKRAFAKTAV
jgi:Rrf2 family protein